MAGRDLKSIASYSEDVINLVVREKLSLSETKEFESNLTTIKKALAEVPKKQKTGPQLPTSQEIFERHVVKTILENLQKYEELEESGRCLNIDISLNFNENLENMNLNELKEKHKVVLQNENNIKIVDIITKFYRGLIYHAAYKKSTKEVFKRWLTELGINVSTSTVQKYIAFTALIVRLPRLIICQLNFSQLIEHKNRIVKHLGKEENLNLASRLSQTVEVISGGTRITIGHQEVDIPTARFSTSADAEFVVGNTKDNEMDFEPVPKCEVETEDICIDQLGEQMNAI